MPEEQHEIGRRGLLEAKAVLHRVFGTSIDLPFNAYDHPEKVKFDDPVKAGGTFNFDLAGILRRRDTTTMSGERTVEVFVEVKNYAEGSKLRPEYAEFLRRAAIVGSSARHEHTWFMFLSAVPFGTTTGVQLCDGTFLKTCCATWEGAIEPPEGLWQRTTLLFANLSLRRTLDVWGSATP